MAPRSRFDSILSLGCVVGSAVAIACGLADAAIYLVLLAIWVAMPVAKAKGD